jgi:hypothetical protein
MLILNAEAIHCLVTIPSLAPRTKKIEPRPHGGIVLRVESGAVAETAC